MNVAINDMQAYLADRYCGWATEQGMFLKLVEELGEVAEVINKRAGIKPSDDEDLKEQLASELADMLHYIVAIAGINNIDMEKAIIENKSFGIVATILEMPVPCRCPLMFPISRESAFSNFLENTISECKILETVLMASYNVKMLQCAAFQIDEFDISNIVDFRTLVS